MSRYLVRRVALALPVLWGVATLVFLVVRVIPGDPARVMAGDLATQDQVNRLRHTVGLDRPLTVQYLDFITLLARGNLGRSIATGDPVASAIMVRLPYTIELALVATALGASIGIGLGVVSALNHRRVFDVAVSLLSVSGMSMATYWLGLMLIIVFAVKLHWLPASGATQPLSIVLPSVTLATLSMALVSRMSRSAMLEVLSQDYVRTARAKGLARSIVIGKHALRNTLLPVITAVGLQFGTLLGGSVLAETVFSWPGMGRYLVDSIFARDYPAIQGSILVFSAGFILVNIIVDVLYSAIDPRIIRG